MNAIDPRSTAERVLAVLVVTGDQPWHEVVATRLARRPPTRLIVVDNGGSPVAEQVAAAAGGELLRLRRPVPYGDAVALAATCPLAEDAELLWLLHDDLVMDDDALDGLVAALDARPDVAIVGPKLFDWSRQPHLQSVGMTIDALGRAETHLQQPGELDQGQHDHRDRTLYVPSAGMLVRRGAFLALGGFDRRMISLRDDLDLCWRAWLSGREVEVVPQARGWHVAAATRSARVKDRWRPATTRYLAERHTLAAMLKNLGPLRLAWTLPLYLLLVAARTLGFLLTRQVAVAAAAPAAVAWNVANLPGTLRLRRAVQRSRARSDAEISDLLARGSWRTRAYVEALADWVGRTGLPAPDGDARSSPGHRRARSPLQRGLEVVRVHPAAVVGAVLGVAWLAACIPLLGGGQIVGGQVAAWPQAASEFLAVYSSGWNAGALASSAFPSPVLAVLGAAGALVGGAAWPAQRLVVLGLVPLTWLVALRAGRLVTDSRGPRALGATLYATCPLVLGAFGDGRLDVLVVAAALPIAVLQAARIAQPGVAPGRAWRAVAGLAIVIAVAVAAAPMAWPVVAAPIVGVVAAVAAVNRRARSPLLWRLLAVGLGAGGLLLPWLLGLDDGVAEPVYPPVALSLLEAMTGRAGLLDALPPPAATLWAVAVGVVVLGAVAFGLRDRAATVVLLLVGLIVSSGAAVLAARAADPPLAADPLTADPLAANPLGVWAPFVVLPAALAVAGLGVVTGRCVLDILRRHGSGVRRALALVTAAAIALGPLATIATVVRQPGWDELHRAPELVPLFVDADAERVGPYRVLLLEGDENRLAWEAVEAGGRSMTSVGARADARLSAALDDVVTGLVSGSREAVGAAGLLNVRYVVTRDETTRALIADAVGDLEAVEPLAGGGGRVYEVRTWLPRVAALDADVIRAAADGQPLDADRVEQAAVPRTDVGRHAGGPVDGEVLWIAEPDPAAWVADASGRPVDGPVADLPVPVTAFILDGQSEGVHVEADATSRRLWIAWQVGVVLVLLSLALRAPGQPVPRRTPAHTGPLHRPPMDPGRRHDDPARAAPRHGAAYAGLPDPEPAAEEHVVPEHVAPEHVAPEHAQ